MYPDLSERNNYQLFYSALGDAKSFHHAKKKDDRQNIYACFFITNDLTKETDKIAYIDLNFFIILFISLM